VKEICKHFKIAKADHVQLSFHRPNLDLRVTPCAADERKQVLYDRLSASDGSAVVYVTRQETAESVATFLEKKGLSVQAYHAGLPDDFRSAAQQSFMSGEIRVIVATIAFGMGIDKSNIRHVIHYNLPKSLENYTQEIGRAGRDGDPAVCELLACADDLTVLENFIYSDTPSPLALSHLIDRILRLGDDFDISIYDLSVSCDIRASVISTMIAYLETDGILEAKGVFYGTYRLRFLRKKPQILAGLSDHDRRFLSQLLEKGKDGRSWTAFEPSVIALELGVSRKKVVAVLGGLEAAGDAIVKVSGVRHGFKMKKDPGNLRELSQRYGELFQQREQADLARLSQVLELSAHDGCLTGYLTGHFGEKLNEPCGHCDRCRGKAPEVIERSAVREPSDEEWAVVNELVLKKHASLGSDRQLARFLCGMSSPATLRARLTRDDAYGLFADMPFADVRAIAESV